MKGKLLLRYDVGEAPYDMRVEVYLCAEHPACKLLEIRDLELCESQGIHLPAYGQAELRRALGARQ